MSARAWACLAVLAGLAALGVLVLAQVTGYTEGCVTALRAAAMMSMLALVGMWLARHRPQ